MRRIHSPSSMVSPDMVSPLLQGYGTEMMFLTQRLMDVVTKKADVSVQAEGLSECCGVYQVVYDDVHSETSCVCVCALQI